MTPTGADSTQLRSDSIHAAVAVFVMLCITVLSFAGKVPADVTGAVATGVVGYVAGRSGPVLRNLKGGGE